MESGTEECAWENVGILEDRGEVWYSDLRVK